MALSRPVPQSKKPVLSRITTANRFLLLIVGLNTEKLLKMGFTFLECEQYFYLILACTLYVSIIVS